MFILIYYSTHDDIYHLLNKIASKSYLKLFLVRNTKKTMVMSVKSAIEQAEKAGHPVASAIKKGIHSRVLAIAFKKGMRFKEHMTHLPSKLVVLSGKIFYIQNSKKTELNKYDELQIPVNVMHTIEASEPSLCLLIQGDSE